METEKTYKTKCSYCEKIINDNGKKQGEFISHCGRFSVVGNCKESKGGKMEETKQEDNPENKIGTAYYVTCNGCKKKKFTRDTVYQSRIKKFGSEEKMLQEYLCRDCRKVKTEEAPMPQ